MTRDRRFIVVGNGKMASDILEVIAASPGAEAVGAVGDPRQETPQSRLANSCRALGIPYTQTARINSAEVVDDLARLEPDFIISANNFQIFRAPTLALAKQGIVNFHNGPLPRYGGLNACSWALFNGENAHGVTWHLVDDGIDSGPVLAQRLFDVQIGERAISLIARCIQEGTSLFEELLPSLLRGKAQPLQQAHERRLYYGLKDRPFHGFLPWWEGFQTLARLSHALSFHPLPNLFYRPAVRVHGWPEFFVGEFSVREGELGGAGLVSELEGQLIINGVGCHISVDGFFDSVGEEIPTNDLIDRFGMISGATLEKFS